MVTGETYEKVYETLLSIYPEHEGALNQRQLDTVLIRLATIPIRGLSERYGELLPDNVYIMPVLPSSIDSAVGHFIVVDTRCVPYAIFDPSIKKDIDYSKNPPKIWGGLVKITTPLRYIA